MTFTVTKYDSIGQWTIPCEQWLNDHLHALLHEVVHFGLRVFHAYHMFELMIEQVHAVSQLYSVLVLEDYFLSFMVEGWSHLDAHPYLI